MQYPEIIVRRNETIFVYNKEDMERREDINDHIESLEKEYDELKSKTDEKFKIHLEEISSRITKLKSTLKILRFGGDSQDRLNTLEFQLEDAINTARVAYKEGIITGGGLTLINFFVDNYIEKDEDLSDEEFAFNKLLTHFLTPHSEILRNAGFDVVHEAIVKNAQSGEGIDLNDMFGRLIDYKEHGVLDAKKGIEIAITKSATTAQQFVLTNHFVTEHEIKKVGN